jgi:hypothetical protein
MTRAGTVFVNTASPGQAQLTDAAVGLAVACPLAGDAGQPASAQELEGLIEAQTSAKPQRLVLRGGDLLRRPEALSLLALARKVAPEVEVWTGAVAMARPEVAAAVRKAGATAVGLPLYGDSAAAHDWLAGQSGHFQRTLKAVQVARAAGLQVVVLAPVLRPTFRNLQGLMQKCIPAGVFGVRLLAPDGPDQPTHPLLVPHAMSGPHLRAALTVAKAGKLAVWSWRLPPCILGDFAASQLDTSPNAAPVGAATEAADAYEYGPLCDQCSWHSRCPGISSARAAGHGWVGLMPRQDSPAAK